MAITLFGVDGTLISFTVISLGRLTSSLNIRRAVSCSVGSLAHWVAGALGLISRLNIGDLELGDYLGQFII